MKENQVSPIKNKSKKASSNLSSSDKEEEDVVPLLREELENALFYMMKDSKLILVHIDETRDNREYLCIDTENGYKGQESLF